MHCQVCVRAACLYVGDGWLVGWILLVESQTHSLTPLAVSSTKFLFSQLLFAFLYQSVGRVEIR